MLPRAASDRFTTSLVAVNVPSACNVPLRIGSRRFRPWSACLSRATCRSGFVQVRSGPGQRASALPRAAPGLFTTDLVAVCEPPRASGRCMFVYGNPGRGRRGAGDPACCPGCPRQLWLWATWVRRCVLLRACLRQPWSQRACRCCRYIKSRSLRRRARW